MSAFSCNHPIMYLLLSRRLNNTPPSFHFFRFPLKNCLGRAIWALVVTSPVTKSFPSVTMAEEKAKCRGKTKDGKTCTREVKGTQFCFQHDGQSQSTTKGGTAALDHVKASQADDSVSSSVWVAAVHPILTSYDLIRTRIERDDDGTPPVSDTEAGTPIHTKSRILDQKLTTLPPGPIEAGGARTRSKVISAKTKERTPEPTNPGTHKVSHSRGPSANQTISKNLRNSLPPPTKPAIVVSPGTKNLAVDHHPSHDSNVDSSPKRLDVSSP